MQQTQKTLYSILTNNGRTTVPKKVREALRIKPGQRLQWDLAVDGRAIVCTEPSALDLYGTLKPKKKFTGIPDEKEAVRGHVSKSAAWK